MTTIFTDGKFMIADRRSTRSVISKDVIASSGRRNSNYEFSTDATVKLTVPPNMKFRGKQIACMATAGDGYIGDHFRNLAAVKRPMDLDALLDGIDGMPCNTSETSATILALFKNGEIRSFEIRSRFENRVHVYAVKDKEHPLGPGYPTLYSVGSGSSYWGKIASSIVKPVSMLDVFLFSTHLDPYSVESYSVYSLEEDHLYTHVNPSGEEVEAAIKRIQDATVFYNPSRKAKPVKKVA